MAHKPQCLFGLGLAAVHSFMNSVLCVTALSLTNWPIMKASGFPPAPPPPVSSPALSRFPPTDSGWAMLISAADS